LSNFTNSDVRIILQNNPNIWVLFIQKCKHITTDVLYELTPNIKRLGGMLVAMTTYHPVLSPLSVGCIGLLNELTSYVARHSPSWTHLQIDYTDMQLLEEDPASDMYYQTWLNNLSRYCPDPDGMPLTVL
jgi:hypothetical protein